MKKLDELIKALRPLIEAGASIHEKYEVGENYKYEKLGGSIIEITMKNTYFDKRSKKKKTMRDDIVHKHFSSLIRRLKATVIKVPVTRELGYDDSLRWLFHHYPFGENNNSNCILVNGDGYILGINFNGEKRDNFIFSLDAIVKPNYIVINNCKKLEGTYKKSDYSKLKPILENYFN